ncbi:selection and upkeep of intraepithelial T-cells protein 1 isoform X2 [Chanos chanos]|uniref:Selection and upkeep of intraepithelial T-cells protein 1 isoform X2 n=1 Tax=Chanos chanos TaxID=29144 RepID=A0A6J2WF03_CHACN|nr:selection and upkeep of intraepithelial T-cells protein 1-like isoform X2 [Chanos chanos]
MWLFLSAPFCHATAPETFSVQVPDGPFSAKLGSSVVFPCSLSPSFSAVELEVRWYRPNKFNTPVLFYKDLKIQESPVDPQCSDRVSLIGRLEEGNVSLKLENITLSDRGDYECHISSGVWYDKGTTSLTVNDSDDLVRVSSWLLFSPSESEWISCSVSLSDQEEREGRAMPVRTKMSTASKTPWRAFVVMLVISLLSLSVVCILLFILYKRTHHQKSAAAPWEPVGTDAAGMWQYFHVYLGTSHEHIHTQYVGNTNDITHFYMKAT